MAAIDFPNSPTLNQQFTAAGKTWQWNGTAWLIVSSTAGESGVNSLLVMGA